MFVSVGLGDSEVRPVLSGVPQGSVIGPLLFLIYVNSLTDGLGSKWFAFADDFKLYCTGNMSDGDLQRDLDVFAAKASSWNLKLNPAKCVVMKFGGSSSTVQVRNYSLHGRELEVVESHRDLGVVVDNKLRFHAHIRSIANKSRSLVNQLLRGTVCRSRKFMITLFISHIRPVMDFSARLWNVGYLSDTRMLEKVQRSWIGQTQGMDGLRYEDCIKELGVYSVYGRLLRGDLIKIWQAFHSTSDVGLDQLLDVQSHSATRSNGYKLAIPRCRTELRRKFWSVRCVQRWNSLPETVVQAETVETFKRRLDGHVGDLFYSTVGW